MKKQTLRCAPRVLRYCLLLLLAVLMIPLVLTSCEDLNEYAVISENNLSSDGFRYTLYENGSAMITGVEDPSKTTLTIPSKIDSYKVVSIGDSAFEGNAALKYVRIEEGPRAIGKDAFRQCYSLLRIDLAASVKTVGEYAFDSCEKLCEVNYCTKVESFGKGAFYRCISLSVIEFPETLRTIGDDCFFGCKALPKLRLPKKIESVGFGAFAQCTSMVFAELGGLKVIPGSMFEKNTALLEVEIGNGVTEIGERAFRGCSDLKDVSIGKNVAYVGGTAFDGTPWLVQQKDEFLIVGDGVLLKYNGKDAEVTVPQNVKVIADAFSGVNKLERITIGGKVDRISQYAFSGCIKLKSVVIEGKVKTIEDCAFLGCMVLESVEFPESLETIGDNAFSNCPALKKAIYAGSYSSWYKITVGSGNLNLQSAEMEFKK